MYEHAQIVHVSMVFDAMTMKRLDSVVVHVLVDTEAMEFNVILFLIRVHRIHVIPVLHVNEMIKHFDVAHVLMVIVAMESIVN